MEMKGTIQQATVLRLFTKSGATIKLAPKKAQPQRLKRITRHWASRVLALYRGGYVKSPIEVSGDLKTLAVVWEQMKLKMTKESAERDADTPEIALVMDSKIFEEELLNAERDSEEFIAAERDINQFGFTLK